MTKLDRNILIGWGIASLFFFVQLVKAQKAIANEDITAEPGSCYAKDGICAN